MAKIGDRLVVQNSPFPVYVERIEEDPTTASTILHLDWKEHGKSRVYAHDENKVWYVYSNSN